MKTENGSVQKQEENMLRCEFLDIIPEWQFVQQKKFRSLMSNSFISKIQYAQKVNKIISKFCQRYVSTQSLKKNEYACLQHLPSETNNLMWNINYNQQK